MAAMMSGWDTGATTLVHFSAPLKHRPLTTASLSRELAESCAAWCGSTMGKTQETWHRNTEATTVRVTKFPHQRWRGRSKSNVVGLNLLRSMGTSNMTLLALTRVSANMLPSVQILIGCVVLLSALARPSCLDEANASCGRFSLILSPCGTLSSSLIFQGSFFLDRCSRFVETFSVSPFYLYSAILFVPSRLFLFSFLCLCLPGRALHPTSGCGAY